MYLNSTTQNRVLVSARVLNCMETTETHRDKTKISVLPLAIGKARAWLSHTQSLLNSCGLSCFAIRLFHSNSYSLKKRFNTLSYVFRVCFPRNQQRFEGVFVSVASGLKLSHLSVFMDLEIRLGWIQQVLNILKNWQERFYFINLVSAKKESESWHTGY